MIPILGILVPLAVSATYLGRLAVLRAPSSRRAYDVAVALGLALALIGRVRGGPAWTTFAAAAVGALWFVLTWAELRIPGLRRPIAIGDRLPDFEATDTAGRVVRTADLVARAPAVLVVFRGRW